MARKTLIQVRRDTAANWTSTNPTLSAGEPGFETDTGKVKFGDGSTAWTGLAYVGSASGVSSYNTRTGAVVPVTGDYYGAVASALTGATQASRYVGATTSGAPGSGTFAVGDFVVARDGHVFVCTTAGSPGTWADVGSGAVASVFTRTGAVVAADGDYYGVVAAAATGATQATRYVGGTTSGAPGSGAHSTGDFVISRDGHIYICTSGGTPGTWIDAGAYGGPPSGSASGDQGTHEGRVYETSGPTSLTIGTIADGNYLKRSGSTLIGGGGSAGQSVLVYRYTVAGSDKASIDTGADTPDAGSNDWTGADVLEVFMLLRTDNAGAIPSAIVFLNNDGAGTNYDLERFSGTSTSVTAVSSLAQAKWTFNVHGSGGSASYAAQVNLTFTNFAGTTFFKTGLLQQSVPDATAGNNQIFVASLGYRSTSAITRLTVGGSGTDKLKVGSQLLIYKRLAS